MKTRFDSAEIWRTNNDTAVSIKELETSHLMNIVRMLLRRPETVQRRCSSAILSARPAMFGERMILLTKMPSHLSTMPLP